MNNWRFALMCLLTAGAWALYGVWGFLFVWAVIFLDTVNNINLLAPFKKEFYVRIDPSGLAMLAILIYITLHYGWGMFVILFFASLKITFRGGCGIPRWVQQVLDPKAS